MTASRSQTPLLALLASAAVLPLTSSAQPAPAPASQAEREIAITGAVDAPPVVVYGAPDVPLVLSFDAPLRKDAAVTVQGADVRAHPFRPDAVVIMPSGALAAQKSVPVLVPLSDGDVALTLAFSPPRRDTTVRIVRHATSTARPAVTGGELKELLLLSASKVLDTTECASADGAAVLREVAQGQGALDSTQPWVCGGGAFAYMSAKAWKDDCTPATARLTRGEESAEVLLLAPQTAARCGRRTCWLVVARPPLGDGGGFTLELLAEDGAPCLSSPVNLKPNSP